MATFKTCVRSLRSDGYYPVYIRVTQDRKSEYIKTNLMVFHKDVKKKEIKDPYVVVEGATRIKHYIQTLNLQNTEDWTAKEITAFLESGDGDVSFSEFAKTFVAKIYNAGRDKTAKGYNAALKSFYSYMGTENVQCRHITHNCIKGYIESLMHTASAKNAYPICIKTIFKAASDEHNDYDRDIIKIKNDPFRKIKIPKEDTPEKKALDVDVIRNFFTYELPESRMALPLQELGRDICLISFCLAGINTVDLYNMDKTCLKDDWLLCYNRSKVEKRRSDKAYMEIKIPTMIRHLFDKYADKKGERLFNFYQRFASSDSFNADVNTGIKTVCKRAELTSFSFYAFRHSWATIADNNLDAPIELIAFGLNHQSAHKITWRYTKKDFTKVDRLNEDVLKFVFG